MRNINKVICLIPFLLSLLSCTETIRSEKGYASYISEPANGLTKKKEVNNFVFEAKYLPPQYLALMEMAKDTSLPTPVFDSLVAVYSGYLTFLFTIATDNEKLGGKDIMSYNVYTDDAFRGRFLEMSLNLGSYISLEAGKNELLPALHNFENTQDITGKRTMYIVFADPIIRNRELPGTISLKFDDGFFETGVSYFSFKTKDLFNNPGFKLD